MCFIFSTTNIYAKQKDSSGNYSYRVIAGLNYQAMSDFLTFGASGYGVYFYDENKLKSLSWVLGFQQSLKITPRKTIENTLFYSDAYYRYVYENVVKK